MTLYAHPREFLYAWNEISCGLNSEGVEYDEKRDDDSREIRSMLLSRTNQITHYIELL